MHSGVLHTLGAVPVPRWVGVAMKLQKSLTLSLSSQGLFQSEKHFPGRESGPQPAGRDSCFRGLAFVS